MALLANTNPACRDLGYAEEESCVLQIAVHCQDEKQACSGSIELDYESVTPRRIYSGQTKHAILQADSKHYFYMNVQQPAQDIFAVMSELSGDQGDADLYITVQRLNKSLASAGLNSGAQTGYLSWWLPTADNHTFSAKSKMGTEMVAITEKQLNQSCGWPDSKDECMIIFAVLPTNVSDDTQIMYNFVAYKGFMQLESAQPAYGLVKEKEYRYFLFKVGDACGPDCQLIISVNTYSGTPTIVASRGLTSMPTLKEHDFLMETY